MNQNKLLNSIPIMLWGGSFVVFIISITISQKHDSSYQGWTAYLYAALLLAILGIVLGMINIVYNRKGSHNRKLFLYTVLLLNAASIFTYIFLGALLSM